MKKAFFKLMDFIEWQNKHKRISFGIGWILYSLIAFLSGWTVLHWQFWALLTIALLLALKNYTEGRLDQEEFEEEIRADLP